MSPPYLLTPLRSLQDAEHETRDEQLERLSRALDLAESVAADVYGDLTTQRERNLCAEIQNRLRDAVEACKLIQGRDVAPDDDGPGAEADDRKDLAWHRRRTL